MSTSEDSNLALVFVGGVGRSGTSLVQKILDLHPKIYAGPELQILRHLMVTYVSLRGGVQSGKLSMVLDLDHVRESYRNFFISLFRLRLEDEPYQVISEKTPDNLLVFEALSEVFPDARFVWVVRDPRDVVCSIRSVRQRGRQQEAARAKKSLYDDLGEMRDYFKAGERFRQRHGDRLHIIHYEDLVTDPRAEVGTLSEFLHIPFHERMLETERPNDTSKAIKRRNSIWYDKSSFDRPIDSSSVGNWKEDLGFWSRRAIETYMNSKEFMTLSRYDLDQPSWSWRVTIRAVKKIYTLGKKASRFLFRS